MIDKYINFLDIDNESKPFIIRQIHRMPDHYYFCLFILCSVFFSFRIKHKKIHLLDKLISSLYMVKSYEN